MKVAKSLAIAVLAGIGWMEAAFGQEFVVTKSRMTVLVQRDNRCQEGISLTGHSLRGHILCADYPASMAKSLGNLVGSTVELEAFWTYDVRSRSRAPVAVGSVTMIGNGETELGEHPTAPIINLTLMTNRSFEMTALGG